MPVFEQNTTGRSPFLFTSDHYGRLIPKVLGDLGLPENELVRHIAWDIGIAGVAMRLSKLLDVHLIAQRYSRLVIDYNRPPRAASSIPILSEATTIPGNEGLSREDAEIRRREIFDPYHRRIDAVIDQRAHGKQPTLLVSLHSFTPVYAGVARPWHIGTLYHRDRTLPPLLLQALRAEGDLVVGDNEPYAVNEETDYTIPVHGEARGGHYRDRDQAGFDRRRKRPAAMGRAARADPRRDRAAALSGSVELATLFGHIGLLGTRRQQGGELR